MGLSIAQPKPLSCDKSDKNFRFKTGISFPLPSTWLIDPKWVQIWVETGRVFNCGRRLEAGGRVVSPPQYRGGPHWPHGPTHSSLLLLTHSKCQEGRVEGVSSVGESVGWQNISGCSGAAQSFSGSRKLRKLHAVQR